MLRLYRFPPKTVHKHFNKYRITLSAFHFISDSIRARVAAVIATPIRAFVAKNLDAKA
ncbi:MAG: hypothetical protein FJZ75_10670 [Bacteroidetes bacterium]|nr:hypothetical protein [Bacteroidota bacterium]